MRTYLLYISFLLFNSNVNVIVAQQLKQQFDAVYNIDPVLYNGRVFTNVYRNRVDGTQYLIGKSFNIGDLKLKNRVYSQQLLNYEVYKQKLLLSFKNHINANQIIEIPLENVQYFYLRNKYFEVVFWNNRTYKVFQVFKQGENKILIHWLRTLKSSTTTTNNLSRFSELKHQIWVLKDGEYYEVGNNKSFVKLFSPEQQAGVKKWLKTNMIKINRPDDKKMQLLVDYWSSEW